MTSEHWADAATEAARKAVPNQAFRDIAGQMARSTERALDYVLQAPVLVLAACYGKRHHRPFERSFITGTFAERCKRGPKLRDLMTEYRVAYGFRTLRTVSIVPSKAPVIFALSQLRDLHPSALAQAIPSQAGDQARWLREIMRWGERMASRSHTYSFGLEWAALASGPIVSRGDFDLTDIADFYLADPNCFSTKWSFDQAKAATERWHRMLGKRNMEAEFFKHHGVGFSEQVDYSPLPLDMIVGDFHVVALDSGEELFAEGRAMHHCVGSYSADVIVDRSRIFSIRDGDRRLATLELVATNSAGRPYRALQLKGPCNAKVRRAVEDAAAIFVEIANRECLLAAAAESEAA